METILVGRQPLNKFRGEAAKAGDPQRQAPGELQTLDSRQIKGYAKSEGARFVGAVNTYIRWYNETRIKVSLGRLRPVRYWQKLGLAA